MGETESTYSSQKLAGGVPDQAKTPVAAATSSSFPFLNEHLDILIVLAEAGTFVKGSDLDGRQGLPPYHRLLELLREMENAVPPLVRRARGKRSGFAITPEGVAELLRRDLIDPPK
jgi:hypothetical protein